MWKRVNIDGLESRIMVSDDGQVFNASTCHEVKQRFKNGYKTVMLKCNGKQRMFGVHQLVCIAFHGDPPTDRHQPDHINRNRADNRPCNLEWVTPSTNIRRAKSRAVRGTAADGSTVTFSNLAMAADFGLNVNAISKSIHRKNSAGSQGFVWEYIAD